MEFGSPGFVEEPIYESISSATGNSIQANLREANTGSQGRRFQPDKRNACAVTIKTQEEERKITVDLVKRTAVFNPTYGQPYLSGNRVEGYENLNFHLNQQREHCSAIQQRINSQWLRETEKGKDHQVQHDDDYMMPKHGQHNTPSTEGAYENVLFKDESKA